MSMTQSQDFGLYAPHAEAQRSAAPWPRIPCLALAVSVSLGMWVGLFHIAVKLVG